LNKSLLNLLTKELLEKFGKGNHIPGSGSASAFNGLMACKLLLTVLKLTIDPKRGKTYTHIKNQCITIIREIEDTIFPKLCDLFDKDSIEFDKSITLRQARDTETNQRIKNSLNLEAQEQLKICTEIPLDIAKLGLILADHAIFVFENCFKPATGDSAVAFSNAITLLNGCYSIIVLNLESFPSSEWTQKIFTELESINEQGLIFEEKNREFRKIKRTEALIKNELKADIKNLTTKLFNKRFIKNEEIENIARDFQNLLFKEKINFQQYENSSLINLLDPIKLIRKLNFQFEESPYLESDLINGKYVNIAGLIDRNNMTISVSKQYPPEVRNFTAAHELGHLLMHNFDVMHRDIPIDSPLPNRPSVEYQADKFAAYFLMPTKLVFNAYTEIYGNDSFELNEESSRALFNKDLADVERIYNSKRKLSRALASSKFYYGRSFISLAQTFKVSVEAMAIRLEELDLVIF
jgi:formiminotetrahydrofolate cyclodeaminase